MGKFVDRSGLTSCKDKKYRLYKISRSRKEFSTVFAEKDISCFRHNLITLHIVLCGVPATRPMAVEASWVQELLIWFVAAELPLKFVEIWRFIRVMVIIPVLRVWVILCLILSVTVLVEKVAMGAVSLHAKVFCRRPCSVYKCNPIEEDVEIGNLAYPMVLVQVPMYNEKEVFQLSIGAACNLLWPDDRIIVQVLDDSTDLIVKELVKKECEKWKIAGKNINYETRSNRNGYKAGALKEGMKHSYVSTCEYIAMFDADFQPENDFLIRTVPFLMHNPDVALVQARWKFVNANECLMTRLQEMTMDYHFKVEQESGSSTFSFFGFNGTAGVWRIHAMNEAGGWNDRTTVEDMDLAVRAGLRGWKFVYLGNVKVKSELPSTFKAYRYQQHRWSCGPANLFRKMLWEVVHAKSVSLWKKFFVIYNFFLARRIISHFVTFTFYCILIPLSVFFPEVEIPKWGIVYIPTIITLLNAVGTPRSIYLIVFWVLFENVMSFHRCKAVLIGLFEAGRVNEWVVTEKLGDSLKTNPNTTLLKRFHIKFWERLHTKELALGIFLMICACYDCIYRRDYYFFFIFPQSISFLTMGFGYIGTVIRHNK